MIVGIMASGSAGFGDEARLLTEIAARAVGRLHHDLLTGGGGGLMEVAGRAFLATPGRGRLIGILRAHGTAHLSWTWDDEGKLRVERRPADAADRAWRPHADNGLAEIVIRTHLPYSSELGTHDLSRNHVNVLTADRVVVLPGGGGTLGELRLALEYGRPVRLFIGAGRIGGMTGDELRAHFRRDIREESGEPGLLAWLRSGGQNPGASGA